MLYCPKCKYEFDQAILVCPDCDERLVLKLSGRPAPAVSPDDSWVLVGGVNNETQSKVARGSLDSSNIPSVFMPSRLDADGAPEDLPVKSLGLVDTADLILVPREFGEEARVLLEAVLGDELIQPEVDNPLI